jgi:outer membrane protein assembly factor BamE (lipoprotein component of BamABCDE complex)
LNGCFEKRHNNGLSLNSIENFEIEIGTSSKNSLIKKYGPPSFESVFNKNTIYYVSQSTFYKNFNSPQLTDLLVYQINLDENENVKDFRKFNQEDVKNIEIADDLKSVDGDELRVLLKSIIDNLQKNKLDN